MSKNPLVDVNFKADDYLGMTVLHVACDEGDYQSVRVLLEHPGKGQLFAA